MLWVILTVLTGATTATDVSSCTKFASETEKTVVYVDGVCYYGFNRGYMWAEAQAKCEGEGLQLAHVQTAAKQRALYEALGLNFGQHWTGLRRIDGEWRWYVNSMVSLPAEDDVAGRWEWIIVGPVAHTTTSGNMEVLKSAEEGWWYRPVCEDIAEQCSIENHYIDFINSQKCCTDCDP